MTDHRKGRIGVDIGGTFTDLVLLDSQAETWFAKVSSTPSEPERAVLAGVAGLLADADLDAGDIEEVVHGTTVGSNTLLQKAGARTGLITTTGFRDILEIGRLRTPGMFDLNWDKPEPLVRRRDRLEVDGRIDAHGEIVTPLDEAGVIAAGQALAGRDIASIAVCFINSYLNPVHELRAGELLREVVPHIDVSLSATVLPEMQEYERTSTVAVNAYVRPALSAYLDRLKRGLAEIGIAAPLLVANSNGGLADFATARQKPVFFISSGRAAGVAGARHLGRAIARPDVIAFDMGGTTASASLVHNGELARVAEYEFRAGISTPSRFIKAGGYLMRVPTVDVAEVGSGAGSIARIDAGGLLTVGPVSAGADPGPACYGLGGTEPTVTDANLVLGYLGTDLAGGSLSLDRKLAVAAIEEHIAKPLGIGVLQAAAGIRDIVNDNMARVIRTVTIERGVDPRSFALLAFGGSGPVHACDLARDLGIREVVFPRMPGVFTAMGMLAGDVERYFIRPCPGLLRALDPDQANAICDELRNEAMAALAAEDFAEAGIELELAIDLRFVGQEAHLSIALPERLTAQSPAALRETFIAAYRATYQYASADEVEVASVRVTGRGRRATRLDFANLSLAEATPGKAAGSRQVQLRGAEGPSSVPVLARESLTEATAGPLILESPDSTVVVPPDGTARRDDAGNIVVTLDTASV